MPTINQGILGISDLTSKFGTAIFSILLAGCAGPELREQPTGVARTIPESHYCTGKASGGDYRDNVLVVERKGDYEPASSLNDESPSSRQAAPSFEDQFLRIADAQKRYRRRMDQRGKPAEARRILIFINGGLNSRSTSLKRAAEQVDCIEAAGYFPIFLIWRSSGPESYWEQISQVRDGYLRSQPRLTTPLYFFGDLGQGLARAPATWTSQFGRWWSGILEGLKKKPEFSVPKSLNFQYDGPQQSKSDFRKDAISAVISSPIKMVTTPFVDGVGRTAWENMLRRTRMTLRRAAEFEKNHALNLDQLHKEMMRYPRGTGAFAKFFSELESCIFKDDQRSTLSPSERICMERDTGDSLKDTELTLIGHSMGTIVINEIIRDWRDLPYRHIVYLAAATSIRDTVNSVVPLLINDIAKEKKARNANQHHEPIRFYNLSLHPVAEKHENTVFEIPPDGSLLTWIDDMFESAPSVTDRTFGRWRNIESSVHVIPEAVRDRMFFRVFGFRKPSPAKRDPGDPIVHGAFSDTEMHYWLPEFWWTNKTH